VSNRMFFAITTAVAGLGAAAILSTAALGLSTRPQASWHGARQSLPSRVLAAARDAAPTADALHVFNAVTGSAAKAHTPLSLRHATIEAGIRSDGLLCFVGTFANRPQGGSCGMSPAAGSISAGLETALNQPQLFFGLAGDSVTGVRVDTDRGSFNAAMQHGAFYVSFPKNAKPRDWVATRRDGSTTTGRIVSDNKGAYTSR